MIAEFMFSGFDGELKDLNGPFGKSSNENHGRPVYSKIGTNQGHKVMMYYWDQRDGEQLHGWWLAPEVGGAHVWAMNPIGSVVPPQEGWKVPWHGKVNPQVKCVPHGKRVNPDGTPTPAPKKLKAGEVPEVPAPVAQPLTPFGPAFQAWQAQTGVSMPWPAQAPGVSGAAPGIVPAVGLPPTQMPLVNTDEELSKHIPVELRKAEFERRTEAQQVKFFEDRLHNLVSQAKHLADQAKKKMAEVKDNPNFRTLLTDKSEGKLSSEDLKNRTEELERVLTTIIRQIQTSKLATTNKILEGEGVIKESKIPIAIWPEVRKKLQAYVKECEELLHEAKEWKTRKEDKEAVLWTKAADTLVDELDVVLQKAEKDVERLKDASALLSADLSEHLCTNDLLAAASATEVSIGTATKAVQAASQAITEKIPLFKNASPAAFQKFRVLQMKIPTWNDEIQKIQKNSLEADKKGREIQAAEEKAKQEKKENEKLERFEKWNQNMIDVAWAEVYVVEDKLAVAEKEATKRSVQKARDAMVALEKTVEDFIMKKDASNKTREILSTTMGTKVRDLRMRVTECQKRISEAEFDEIQDKIMNLSGKVIEFMTKNKKTEKDLFESLSKGANVVTGVQIRAWCEVVANAKKEEVTAAIERADCPRPQTKQTLSLEEFPLLFRVYFQACQGASLIGENDEVLEVPIGTLVMLCGIPNKNLLPVRAVHGEGCGILNAEEPGWARASPYYQCVTETVLTQNCKMADFQIVKRVRVGDRMRVIEPPKLCEQTGVTRLRAQTLSDGKIGYITVTKPGGPEYVKPYPILKELEESAQDPADLEGVHCVDGEPIEALNDGDWVLCHLAKCAGSGTYVDVMWANETIGRVNRKDIRCRGTTEKIRMSKANLGDFVGRIIKKAHHEMKKVKVPEMKLTDANGALLPSDAIRVMGEELENQAKESSDILDAMHETLKEKAQDEALKVHLTNDLYDVAKKYNNLMEKLNDFRHGTALAIQSEVSKARAAEAEREEAERQEREKENEERSAKILKQGSELIEVLDNMCSSELREDASLGAMMEQVTRMELAEKAMEQYFEEELEMAKKEPDSAKFVLELLTLQRKGQPASNEKIGNAFRTYRKRIADAHTKAKVDALTQVRGFMMKGYPNETLQEAVSRLFDRMSVEIDDPCREKDDDDDDSSSSSSEDVPRIKAVEIKRFEREFFSMSTATQLVMASLPWPLNKDQFQMAFLSLGRVTGTDNAAIKDEKGDTIISVEPHTLVEIVKEDPDEDVQVRSFGEGKLVEGTISAKRIQPLGLKYDVLKDTVLTNRVELTQLKVLSRLKKGERVLAVSLPTRSSKLLRMRAKLEDGTVGWLSMVGNDVEYVSPTSWLSKK